MSQKHKQAFRVLNYIWYLHTLIYAVTWCVSICAFASNETNDHDHAKYITTQELNKLTVDNFTAILAQANLVSKNYIANFVKKTNFDDKLKNLHKKLQIKKNVLAENELKNYRHLTQVFLLVKLTLEMMDHKVC